MELIIELEGRGNRHADLLHVSAERISIGRAFDNDVILTDPHVCPHHAALEQDSAGNIQLTDLGSVNGTFTHKRQALDGPVAVTSGDEFILGKSRVRIYRRDHAVSEAIHLTWVEKLAHLAGTPLLAGGIILVAILLNLFFQYANTIKEFNLSRELIKAVGIILLIAIWPACWTLFSRIKKHESRFIAQLSVTIFYVILVTLFQKLINWLSFHFGLNTAINILGITAWFVLTLLLIWLNYYLSVFQSNKNRWVYSLVLTCLLGSFAYLGSSFDADRFKRRPEYASILYLPAITFYKSRSSDAYLADAEYIFTESAAKLEDN